MTDPKSRRGGARLGAGRPKKPDALKARLQVHVGEETERFVRAMGGAAWLRELIEATRLGRPAPKALALEEPQTVAPDAAPDAPSQTPSLAAFTGSCAGALAIYPYKRTLLILDTERAAARGDTVLVRIGVERFVRRILQMTPETVKLALPDRPDGRVFPKKGLWIEGVAVARIERMP